VDSGIVEGLISVLKRDGVVDGCLQARNQMPVNPGDTPLDEHVIVFIMLALDNFSEHLDLPTVLEKADGYSILEAIVKHDLGSKAVAQIAQRFVCDRASGYRVGSMVRVHSNAKTLRRFCGLAAKIQRVLRGGKYEVSLHYHGADRNLVLHISDICGSAAPAISCKKHSVTSRALHDKQNGLKCSNLNSDCADTANHSFKK